LTARHHEGLVFFAKPIEKSFSISANLGGSTYNRKRLARLALSFQQNELS
jgi:hypothetical protein